MKSSSPKPSISEEEDPEEWMTWTVNVLGTDCQNTLISPLIEIEEQIMDEGAWINLETNSVWICSKTNLATNLAIMENQKKEDLTDKQIIPPEYHEFLAIQIIRILHISGQLENLIDGRHNGPYIYQIWMWN